MLKNGRITVEEIPSFFQKLTLADAKELEAEVMQLVKNQDKQKKIYS